MSENVNHTIEEVLENAKKSNRRADLKLIRRAYDFAKSKHGDQLRRSGEPYIIHPVQVAYILSTLGLDESTICAALLHDVIEDTDVTLQDLSIFCLAWSQIKKVKRKKNIASFPIIRHGEKLV